MDLLTEVEVEVRITREAMRRGRVRQVGWCVGVIASVGVVMIVVVVVVVVVCTMRVRVR